MKNKEVNAPIKFEKVVMDLAGSLRFEINYHQSQDFELGLEPGLQLGLF